MVFEGVTERYLVQKPVASALPSIHTSLVKIWPDMFGWFEYEGENSDSDFRHGEYPDLKSGEELVGGFFYRDQEMFERWDWGVVESESFGGEGPLSLLGLRSETGLFSLEVTLPDDVSIDRFSARMLAVVLDSFPGWVQDE
ncbi:hypothetical protein AAFN60_21390 [Roseibacillus persicicus]|uniref:hypothetical protein n=1 Tax=Roseibacillus persicicus TaxID=454148 RepID=UPI00398ACA3C